MKFVFYNDTGKDVYIHPATFEHGTTCENDKRIIEHLELRTFFLPEGTYPWVKLWDYGRQIQILISPTIDLDTIDSEE